MCAPRSVTLVKFGARCVPLVHALSWWYKCGERVVLLQMGRAAAAAYIYVFIAVKQPLLGLRNVNCKSDGVA